MNYKKHLVAAAAVLGLGMSQPSAADCCHDALSCIAAVATGGVSCAVEAAAQEVSGFINRVRAAIDNGQREMNNVVTRLRSEVEGKMQNSERKFVTETQKTEQAMQSVSQSRVGMTLTAMQQAEYDRINRELNDLVAESRRKQAEMQEKIRQGHAAKTAGVNQMSQVFQAALVIPLSSMIAPLVVADPISAAAAIALLAPQIDNVLRNTEQRMTGETGKYQREMEPKLKEMEDYAKESEERARKAEDKLLELKKQDNRFLTSTATRHTTSAAGAAPANRMAVGVNDAQLTVTLQAVNLSLIPKLRADLQGTAAAARRVKPQTPQMTASVNLSGYQNRVRADLDRLLVGKPAAEAQQNTTQLLTDARKRYGADPATLSKIERFLADQAAARGAGTAPPAKVALAPGGAATDLSRAATPVRPTVPAASPTNSHYVDCAVPQLRADVTTRLPEGWWYTPTEGVLKSLRIQTVGNEHTLVCLYQAFDGQVAVMRKPPPGARDCRVDQGGRRFVCQVTVQANAPKQNSR